MAQTKQIKIVFMAENSRDDEEVKKLMQIHKKRKEWVLARPGLVYENPIQAKTVKMDAPPVQVDDLSKLLEEQNQETTGIIEDKASVSQLQYQHSIELAKVDKLNGQLKAERDKLLQDIEKMSQIEATLQQELQVRQVKCECA
jgi:hypothetical protein